MKIALVILHADPRRGGAERYTVDLARGLSRRGHQVSIVATSFPVMFNDITCIHLPTEQWTRTGRYKSFLTQFDSHLHIAPYDIVHVMLPMRRADVYHPHAGLAIEALVGGHHQKSGLLARFVSSVLNRLNPRRRAFASVERRLLNKAHPPIVLCLSDYVKRSVKSFYSLADDKLATLFNAVDLQKFDPAVRPQKRDELRSQYHIAEGTVLAVMVAQDFARKGLAETMRALAVVRQTGVDMKLLVVGSGDVTYYKRLAIRTGVGNDVIFTGRSDDVYSAYAAADLFVLPTRHDPCSLVVLEALAMGVPVISTKQNGATEIMTDGVHGSVLPTATDVSALSSAMRHWADADHRAQARQACLTLRPKLSYDHHLDELLAVYDRAPGHWS